MNIGPKNGVLNKMSNHAKRPIVAKTLIGFICLVMFSSANALNFYQGKVDRIAARMDGNVDITFKELVVNGPGTVAPPADGKARFLIPTSEAGANRILAVIMSAVALNVTLGIASNQAATMTPQVPYQIVLISPN